MPQNLPEQILQRIVKLSVDGNSLREVAKMLGMSQGCISKILRRNWKTGQPHQRKCGGSMKISTPRKTIKCSEWSGQMVSSRLLVCECRWSADLGGGFWPPDIGLGVQLDVIGSLWSSGDVAVSGEGGTECGTSDNGDTVSSVMSPSSLYTTVTVGSGCAVGKGRGWLMPASSLMMEIVARQSWYGVQSTMGGGVTWSWCMEPWTGIGTSRSWGI